MKLHALLHGIAHTIIGDDSVEISGLQYDSRKVEKGDLFFCIQGFQQDGHTYANMAVEKGASGLVVTRKLDLDVPQVLVTDDRKAMAEISAAFYGHPAEKMRMIGVTGTNGKTSITYFL